MNKKLWGFPHAFLRPCLDGSRDRNPQDDQQTGGWGKQVHKVVMFAFSWFRADVQSLGHGHEGLIDEHGNDKSQEESCQEVAQVVNAEIHARVAHE